MPRDRESRLVYSTAGPLTPSAPEAPAKSPATRPGIRLRLERRASGRLVTVLTGLPGTTDEVAALARALRTACGTGGTVRDGAIELQGDQREKVETFLAGRGLRSKRAGG